ncbi:MAG: hypothetical protein Q8K72_00925, partial [Acidimicrobiales bacterium]|nr:hypothetical protein [Acidimicrobiales bacterium]
MIGGGGGGQKVGGAVDKPLDTLLKGAAQPVLVGEPGLVARTPIGRILGHDRLDPGVAGGGADGLLAAHGHADGRDALVVDVGLGLEEGHRGGDVGVAVP